MIHVLGRLHYSHDDSDTALGSVGGRCCDLFSFPFLYLAFSTLDMDNTSCHEEESPAGAKRKRDRGCRGRFILVEDTIGLECECSRPGPAGPDSISLGRCFITRAAAPLNFRRDQRYIPTFFFIPGPFLLQDRFPVHSLQASRIPLPASLNLIIRDGNDSQQHVIMRFMLRDFPSPQVYDFGGLALH